MPTTGRKKRQIITTIIVTIIIPSVHSRRNGVRETDKGSCAAVRDRCREGGTVVGRRTEGTGQGQNGGQRTEGVVWEPDHLCVQVRRVVIVGKQQYDVRIRVRFVGCWLLLLMMMMMLIGPLSVLFGGEIGRHTLQSTYNDFFFVLLFGVFFFSFFLLF
jgi:hypothetical protein